MVSRRAPYSAATAGANSRSDTSRGRESHPEGLPSRSRREAASLRHTDHGADKRS